jgi:hypothetical protein
VKRIVIELLVRPRMFVVMKIVAQKTYASGFEHKKISFYITKFLEVGKILDDFMMDFFVIDVFTSTIASTDSSGTTTTSFIL